MFRNPIARAAASVVIGAIPGALSRYYITEYTMTIFGKDFAYYGTFLINVSGCLIIAYVLTLAARIRNFSPELRLMLTTGFCGAYTTFSTFGLETKILLDKGDFSPVTLYWLGSMILGMVGVKLGVMLAR